VAVDGTLRPSRERLLEGEQVDAVLSLRNAGAAAYVELRLPTTDWLSTDPTWVAFWLRPGERRDVIFRLTVLRWGVHAAGPPAVRVRDRLGVFALEGALTPARELRAYPTLDRLRRMIAPARTRPVLGSEVSRDRGPGIEFADLRPMVAGDRMRSINWRATARRRVPYINVQYPEQSADVVLFLDTFAKAEHGTVDAAVHAAAALAAAHLRRRDRVALVSFGGTLEWLHASAGTTQLYRIIDTLLVTRIRPGFRHRELTHVPRRLLPARALVIALSPLLDLRGVGALFDLRARGYDLTVVEISPLPHVPAGSDSLALRLWRLEREELRTRLRAMGVPVATWDDTDTSLAVVIEEVMAFRRHARSTTRP
jgi:uncharacterized protein (DUF58 family)